MAQIYEIAPDVFRLSVFRSDLGFAFNHFLVRDEEPLLFHTGMRTMFPRLRDAVAKLIDPAKLRWISYSHFESDECGALNDWLAVAPQAQAFSGLVGTMVNLHDFASRMPRALQANETLPTGKYRFRFVPTAHVPHGWDAGVLFEETQKTLFCSDLLFQSGDVPPVTSSDVLERVREAVVSGEAGPFAYSTPYNHRTREVLHSLAALGPQLLATMHGSSFEGDCAAALVQYDTVLHELLGVRRRETESGGR
jgi:flavorubredoxin